MLLAWWINAAALLLGAVLGLRALLYPQWVARLVRLKPVETPPGGFAEFRATYGGFFAFAHGAAFVLTVKYLLGGDHVIGLAATGAAVPLCAAWTGAACGRCFSMLRDRTLTRFNLMSVGFEALMALAIGGPWAAWVLIPPG